MNSDLAQRIVNDVFKELRRAEKKFPGFPTDPLHAVGILNEEVGELNKAVLQWTYEKGSFSNVYEEGIQTAAMALRFLFNTGSFKCRPSDQE